MAAIEQATTAIVAVEAPEDRAKASKPSGPDREEFSGFRIEDRCVEVGLWRSEMATRRHVALSRLGELRKLPKDTDGVVIGVLYDTVPMAEMLNGERYGVLRLTDLAPHRQTLVEIQLRRSAFRHWHEGHLSKQAKRGAIFALVNPFVDSTGSQTQGPAVLRIESEDCILKLGTCPSLSRCQVPRCRNPCNVDRKERLCREHLLKTYAERSMRSLSGGMPRELAQLLEKDQAAKAKRSRLDPDAEKELDAEELERRATASRTAVAQTALRLDERRFWASKNNIEYVKVVHDEDSTDQLACSHRPVLGRGLKEDEGFELDLSDVEREDHNEASRVLTVLAERKEARARAAAREGRRERAAVRATAAAAEAETATALVPSSVAATTGAEAVASASSSESAAKRLRTA